MLRVAGNAHAVFSQHWAFGKGVPKVFLVEVPMGIPFVKVSSAREDGRTWEHGPGTLCNPDNPHPLNERVATHTLLNTGWRFSPPQLRGWSF